MPHHDDFVLVLPPEILRRYDARLLDPETAPRPRDGSVPSPTAYLNGRLLVRGLLGVSAPDRIARLEGALREAGLPVRLLPDAREQSFSRWLSGVLDGDGSGRVSPQDAPRGAMDQGWQARITQLEAKAQIGRLSLAELDRASQTRVHVRTDEGAEGAPDPWELLLVAREAGVDVVDLEHLVIPGGGNGMYWGGQGNGMYWGGQSTGHTVVVAGRTPVSVPLPDPAAHLPEKRATRRPVVVVPDTGIGAHPWFGASSGVEQLDMLLDADLRRAPGEVDPEGSGVRQDLSGVLDALSGHGTFIAGIIRQQAPAARVVGLPVLDSAGIAAEGDVQHLLRQLLVGHEQARQEGSTDFGAKGGVIDVLNLSLGFYHQDGEREEHSVRELMRSFAASGVLVVAAAGNQGTRTPLYPAGWGAKAGVTPGGDEPPLVAVGAHNPDRSSVALFSNSGPWVTTHRPGVNVVSTLPETLNGSGGPAWSTRVDGHHRSTADPDDLSGGFGVWSGTSFAAPWLAGELAARLDPEDLDDTGTEAMCRRARAALGATLGWT